MHIYAIMKRWLRKRRDKNKYREEANEQKKLSQILAHRPPTGDKE